MSLALIQGYITSNEAMNVEEQVVIRIGSGITRRELPTKQSLSLARRARAHDRPEQSVACTYPLLLWLLLGICVQKVYQKNLSFRYQQKRILKRHAHWLRLK